MTAAQPLSTLLPRSIKVENGMADNETIIRELYRRAEVQDSAGFTALFAPGGYFHDISAGQKYLGADIG